MLERLHKVLARAGVAALRPAEDMIMAGRVTVNGRVVRELGARVDPDTDVIAVDGQLVEIRQPSDPYRYLALNKPVGVVSTAYDPQGRPTVVGLLPSDVRLFPVGRLDSDSEGLILLTNDGDLAYRLTHPRFEVEKEYRVLLDHTPRTEDLRRWREGVELDGQMTMPAWIEVLDRSADSSWVRVVMREGRKRQIREVARLLGYDVLRLIRVREGPLSLGELAPGAWRELTSVEVQSLRAHTQHIPSRAADEERERRMADSDRPEGRRLRVIRGQRRPEPSRSQSAAGLANLVAQARADEAEAGPATSGPARRARVYPQTDAATPEQSAPERSARGVGQERPRQGAPRPAGGGAQYGDRRGSRQQGNDQQRDQGGYRQRDQGGYQPRDQGGYQPREQGGYQPRDQGNGQQRDQGGYRQREQGGYQPRDQGNGQQRDQGGYRQREQGNYQPREQGNDQQREQGGYRQRDQGGYQPRRPYDDAEGRPRRSAGPDDRRNDRPDSRDRSDAARPSRPGPTGQRGGPRDYSDRGGQRDYNDRGGPRNYADRGGQREYGQRDEQRRGPAQGGSADRFGRGGTGRGYAQGGGGYGNRRNDDRSSQRPFDRRPGPAPERQPSDDRYGRAYDNQREPGNQREGNERGARPSYGQRDRNERGSRPSYGQRPPSRSPQDYADRDSAATRDRGIRSGLGRPARTNQSGGPRGGFGNRSPQRDDRDRAPRSQGGFRDRSGPSRGNDNRSGDGSGYQDNRSGGTRRPPTAGRGGPNRSQSGGFNRGGGFSRGGGFNRGGSTRPPSRNGSTGRPSGGANRPRPGGNGGPRRAGPPRRRDDDE